MFGLLLRRVFADHVSQENYVKQSHLDWIIVRPGAFRDGNRTGEYRHGFPGTAQATIAEVGGKGYSLIRMAEAGLQVPPGAVLTTEFFAPWFDESLDDERGGQRVGQRGRQGIRLEQQAL